MPTENRSSNTEMVSVPRYLAEEINAALINHGHVVLPRGLQEAMNSQTEHHQVEPVAVLYTNGTVLTKADCGDVFDICCKVETPLYTHADPAEVDRLRAENEAFDAGMRNLACQLSAGGYNAESLTADELLEKVQWGITHLTEAQARLVDSLRAQLADLVSAVRSINYGPTHAVRVPGDDAPCYAQRKEWIEWILGLCDAASAEPSAPVERDEFKVISLGVNDSDGPPYKLTLTGDSITEGIDLLGKGLGRIIEQEVMADFERVERVAFEKLAVEAGFEDDALNQGDAVPAWWAWQARAALKREQ